VSDDTNGHRCIFYWSYGEMTREHPMSKRVLDLAGFTLDDIHIEIEIPLDQLTPEYVAERSTRSPTSSSRAYAQTATTGGCRSWTTPSPGPFGDGSQSRPIASAARVSPSSGDTCSRCSG